ncbi:hypothetical protein PM082_020897 [Marasmius tenuissimus]|nr:hypothetical protein PM082_020897 [Marasmius tenuissimus]
MPEARCGLDTLERDAIRGGIAVRAKSIDLSGSAIVYGILIPPMPQMPVLFADGQF